MKCRWIAQAFGLYVDPVSSSPEELAALIVADGARWARAVKLSGARLD